MTPPTKDLPDYKRMTYEEMRKIVAWGYERGLISVKRTLEDRPNPDEIPKAKLKSRFEFLD